MNWKWFINSFSDKDTGAGAKRLTAFALMLCVAYIHLRFIDISNATTALGYDLFAIGVLFSIIKMSDIIELIQLKNGISTKVTTEIKQVEETKNEGA